MVPETKICTNCRRSFTITPDEQDMYERLDMPLPKICFHCRVRRHLAFWVFGKFRYGKSDLSGEKLITTLPAKTRFPVYTAKEWLSDAWEAPEMKYDQNRPFFNQLRELQSKTPHSHQTGFNNTNSDWCDDTWDCKNCYLSRSQVDCEDLIYSYRNVNGKNSSDLTYTYDCEKSYDITYCFNCFNTRYAFGCRDCINGAFLYDCRNVQDSFMCWNLRNKRNCILNVPYSKEDYHAKMAEINFGSCTVITELRHQFETILRDQAVHRENMNLKVADSLGNYMTNCNRCKNCFNWENSEDCFNCLRGTRMKSAIDVTGTFDAELSGNVANSRSGYMCKYTNWSSNCRFSEYLDQCMRCENCFGCVGLKDKKFRILNKQYSEEEYKRLREGIIQKMKDEGTYGDFLPWSMVYSGYNVSSAHVYFPLNEDQATAAGIPWEEATDPQTDGISPDGLPDDIKDVKDSIATQALICPATHYRFNISARELAFYRMMNIPLPRTHSDHRNLERFKKISVLQAYPHHCTFCDKEVMAYYPPEWGYQKIACEECYRREIS